MSTFKTGDRVQMLNDDGLPRDGEVLSMEPPKRERPNDYWRYSDEEQEEMAPHATIKWNDGTESVENADHLDEEDNEIERQFRMTALSVGEKIQEKLVRASELLSEAEALAEAHGIPFSSNISPLGQDYTPTTFSSMWEVDREFARSVTDAYPGGEYDCEGWEHSAVCY